MIGFRLWRHKIMLVHTCTSCTQIWGGHRATFSQMNVKTPLYCQTLHKQHHHHHHHHHPPPPALWGWVTAEQYTFLRGDMFLSNVLIFGLFLRNRAVQLVKVWVMLRRSRGPRRLQVSPRQMFVRSKQYGGFALWRNPAEGEALLLFINRAVRSPEEG